MSETSDDAEWLAAFHAGERWVLEACYRDHAARLLAAARGVVGAVDAETVTHEVFYRLLSDAKMRDRFRGGSIAGWLTRVAMHSAIDDLRRRRREAVVVNEKRTALAHQAGSLSSFSARSLDAPADEEVEAKMLVERFRRECLPPKLEPVFDARFLRQLSQREAARELGMHRTTLAYQEEQVQRLLEAFLLDGATTTGGDV